MYENRVGDIKFLYHPDDGLPEFIKPFAEMFTFKESKYVLKGRYYFLDTGKFKIRVPEGTLVSI